MQYIMERYGLKDELQPISTIHGKKFPVKEKNLQIIQLYNTSVNFY